MLVSGAVSVIAKLGYYRQSVTFELPVFLVKTISIETKQQSFIMLFSSQAVKMLNFPEAILNIDQ